MACAVGCDRDHRLPVANPSDYSRLRMKKRFIAAIVLASLAEWSVPVAFASAPLSRSSTSEKSAQQTAATHDASCCPGVPSRFEPPVFVTAAPAEMPCGEQHPCCAKPAPPNSPGLPAPNSTVRRGSDGAPVTIADQHRDGRPRIAAGTSGSNPFQPYSVRSTVLRI